MSESHHRYVADRYGSRAGAYVASAVHAAGEDLDRIEDVVRGASTARVLDLGCGGGHVSYRVAPHVAEVVAVDVTAAMLDAVRATAAERGLGNVQVRQGAAESLPFEAGRFDVVVSRYSAHHWRDVDAGLRETRRVLAPGGRAVLVDVVAPDAPLLDTHFQAIELLRDPSHVRNYSPAEWMGALARAGFTVTAVARRRLRMEFASWVARTATPEVHAAAIRSLQDGAPAEVRRHFAIEDDGSFLLDAVTWEAEASGGGEEA
ncbi:class I SAM-dependent methyltransferase [Azospirillum sp. ST 5-10]|uniref:class I SAM-dependent methyltransferase n=1 Tax=unclassified Azospirillum TaxID=2630922 RepID=UPI003F49B9BC